MYNDLEGADEHFLVRNVINALGMGFYSSGALAIACGRHHSTNSTGYQWIGVISAIVLTTLQIQDMGDQAGDRLKGRKTLPLVMGDGFARWTIASSVMLWSIAGPAFWRPGMLAYVLPLLTGSTLALRVLLLKSIEADKASWKMWCVWIVSMYLTPLLAPGPIMIT
jgi:4-hydroxybenzoate polyprenyltransferase